MNRLDTFSDGWRYFWHAIFDARSVWAVLGFVMALSLFRAACEITFEIAKAVWR